jgi:hypothetical protein
MPSLNQASRVVRTLVAFISLTSKGLGAVEVCESVFAGQGPGTEGTSGLSFCSGVSRQLDRCPADVARRLRHERIFTGIVNQAVNRTGNGSMLSMRICLALTTRGRSKSCRQRSNLDALAVRPWCPRCGHTTYQDTHTAGPAASLVGRAYAVEVSCEASWAA